MLNNYYDILLLASILVKFYFLELTLIILAHRILVVVYLSYEFTFQNYKVTCFIYRNIFHLKFIFLILIHLNYFLLLHVCMAYFSILFVLTFLVFVFYIFFLKKKMLYFIGSGFLIQPDSSGCKHSASDLEHITERIIENRTPFI